MNVILFHQKPEADPAHAGLPFGCGIEEPGKR
jgi:hypothetical protein